MSVAKAGKKTRAGDIVILLVIIVVAVGAIAGFGFYHEEISDYFRLQGWNLGEIPGLSKEFLDTMAKNDGEKVASMLSPKSTTLKPVREDGKITALSVFRYGSKTPETLVQLAPDTNPTIGKPYLVLLEGGTVAVDVDYPGHHALQLKWDRTEQGWKVAAISRIKAGE